MRAILRWISNHQRRQLSISMVVVGKSSSAWWAITYSVSLMASFVSKCCRPCCEIDVACQCCRLGDLLACFSFNFSWLLSSIIKQHSELGESKSCCFHACLFVLQLFKWPDPHYISYSGNLPSITEFGVGPHCIYSCISFVCGAQHLWKLLLYLLAHPLSL
jgi:hypothetical protein